MQIMLIPENESETKELEALACDEVELCNLLIYWAEQASFKRDNLEKFVFKVATEKTDNIP